MEMRIKMRARVSEIQKARSWKRVERGWYADGLPRVVLVDMVVVAMVLIV